LSHISHVWVSYPSFDFQERVLWVSTEHESLRTASGREYSLAVARPAQASYCFPLRHFWRNNSSREALLLGAPEIVPGDAPICLPKHYRITPGVRRSA